MRCQGYPARLPEAVQEEPRSAACPVKYQAACGNITSLDAVLVLAGIRVNFLHSNLYGVMFCICDENCVDNTGMF